MHYESSTETTELQQDRLGFDVKGNNERLAARLSELDDRAHTLAEATKRLERRLDEHARREVEYRSWVRPR